MKFEGVYIRSDLIPTLQKIWAKHGNIAERSIVRSKNMLACALESLAEVIKILQSSSGNSLTKSQYDYTSSVLMDLLQLHFKVEWLVPYVEKARNLYRSKPLIYGLTELEKNIARVEGMQVKLVKELKNLEKVRNELKEEKSLLSQKIQIKEHEYDLNQCIGEGLL